jgi:hypothetical protein
VKHRLRVKREEQLCYDSYSIRQALLKKAFKLTSQRAECFEKKKKWIVEAV